MAKNPAEPRGVVGMGGKISKTGSYSTAEQQIPRSPAKPMTRQWASASYDPVTGRAARVADDKYHGQGARHGKPESWKQCPDEGPRGATSGSTPRSRPGRW